MAALPPAALAFQEAHIKENHGPMVIGVSAILIALVTAAVLMRFLGRRVRQLPLLSDDWLTIPAWVCNNPTATPKLTLTCAQFFASMLCVTNFLCMCHPSLSPEPANRFVGVHYGVGKHLIAINSATAYEILHVSKHRGMPRKMCAMILTLVPGWIFQFTMLCFCTFIHQTLHSPILPACLHNAEEVVQMGHLCIDGLCRCLGVGLLYSGNGAMV